MVGKFLIYVVFISIVPVYYSCNRIRASYAHLEKRYVEAQKYRERLGGIAAFCNNISFIAKISETARIEDLSNDIRLMIN